MTRKNSPTLKPKMQLVATYNPEAKAALAEALNDYEGAIMYANDSFVDDLKAVVQTHGIKTVNAIIVDNSAKVDSQFEDIEVYNSIAEALADATFNTENDATTTGEAPNTND